MAPLIPRLVKQFLGENYWWGLFFLKKKENTMWFGFLYENHPHAVQNNFIYRILQVKIPSPIIQKLIPLIIFFLFFFSFSLDKVSTYIIDKITYVCCVCCFVLIALAKRTPRYSHLSYMTKKKISSPIFEIKMFW